MTLELTPEALDGFDEAALAILRRRRPELQWRSLRDDEDEPETETEGPEAP